MERLSLVALLLASLASLFVLFGDRSGSTNYLHSLRLHRQHGQEGVSSTGGDHSAFAGGQNLMTPGSYGIMPTADGRKDVANQRYTSPSQRHDLETMDNIETILGRINHTDPAWATKADCCYTYSEKRSAIPKSLQEKRHCRKRLPVALVIGVKKCGTGTLSTFLDLHPAVSMTGETRFPSKNVTNTSVISWIQRMRLSSPYQLTMTENPGFFYYHFLSFLKPYLPSRVKFFLLLRDPVDRLISDYAHLVAHSNAPKDRPFDIMYRMYRVRETLEKTILQPGGDIMKSKLISQGMYIERIKKFLDVYRKDQFMFIDGDAFAKDPYPTMLETERFLGLPKFYKRSHFVKNDTKGFFCAHVPERPDRRCMIPGKGRPHPKLPDRVLRKLHDFYRPYNRALNEQLGLNFSWIFT
ncbi:heparan sulfate glucosamine 3-O-sulfotransferase 1-like [Lytechinus pictus]|uniref:heparan sulfate glucosamine 3-O-sulfotransferase 1-like n=1 Tax=Lytechinus pictus TaxID=7653 RepID=UPI0030BA179C